MGLCVSIRLSVRKNRPRVEARMYPSEPLRMGFGCVELLGYAHLHRDLEPSRRGFFSQSVRAR